MVTETTVYSGTYTVASTGTLEVWVSGKHNYTNLNGGYGNAGAWQLSIYVDGSMYNYANGSGGITDSPVCSVSVPSVATGDHTIRIGWYGATNIILLNVNILIQVLKK